MFKSSAIIAIRMLTRSTKLTVMVGLMILAAASLNASRAPTVLEAILASGELHMVSRNGPTTYYEGANGYVGFEYTLAKRFADYLGVELVIHDEEDLGRMIDQVRDNRVHFAAAGLTVTDKRQQKVKFGPAYMDVTQQVVYQAGTRKPKSVEDLIGKNIVVIGNSSHSEHLRLLQRQYPDLSWTERSDVEMLDLLDMVHNGEIDFTIVDSNAYEISESIHPRARVAFNIREAEQLAWAFARSQDDSLFSEAERFFALDTTTALIQDTKEIYYGHLGELDFSGALVFSHRLDARLPKWKDKLQTAAEAYDLDWQLLAALSYQESHWNPKAKSPTGVRGFMMLTLETAKEMGVDNRLNADQSIEGGAKYFRSIYNRIPERIADPDRTWLALAAYNIGFGHLEDARVLTQHFGGNPDKWADVRENLLLLSKRKYYKFTKHGYARGWEAVEYVQNIRNFHTIIAWNEKAKFEQLAAAQFNQPEFEQFSPMVMEAVKTIAVSSL